MRYRGPVFSFLKNKKGKVFVGLSGGVDSATSAALLLRRGFEVSGVFIKIAIEGYPCPAAQDRIEAMRVAAHLRIPFIEIDLSKEYQKRVFDFSIKEFAQGATPNPDALCNREIKFGLFYDFARARGADYVATGHYAQLVDGKLFAGEDNTKDQSYFLWAVPHEHLLHTLFPVGALKKTQVRKLAKKFGLPNSARPDSQGLCFLGDLSIEDMLIRETHPAEGNVLTEESEIVGRHKGAALYTLGQRHGFVLANSRSEAQVQYVIAKDIKKNTITVSPERYPRTATKTLLTLSYENWIGDAASGAYAARFRYRQQLVPAILQKNDGGNSTVTLLEPHYAPQGQSLVLYEMKSPCLPAGRCLGGGIISEVALLP